MFTVGNETRRERRGSVGSLDSGMSISFQSTSTNTTGSSVTNCKQTDPTGGVYVNTVQVAMAVATNNKSAAATSRAQMQQQIASGQNLLQSAANQIILQTVPPLLPNSAIYQYNNEQNMLHLHEIYEEHHSGSIISGSGSSTSSLGKNSTGRSTDV